MLLLRRIFEKIAKGIATAEDMFLFVSILLIVLLIVSDVLNRTIRGSSIFAANEISAFLGIGIITIGAGSCSRLGHQLKIDMIYRFVHGMKLRYLKLTGDLFCLGMSCIWLSWTWVFVVASYRMESGSPMADIPLFLVKGFLLMGAFLMSVYSLMHVIRKVRHMKDEAPSEAFGETLEVKT